MGEILTKSLDKLTKSLDKLTKSLDILKMPVNTLHIHFRTNSDGNRTASTITCHNLLLIKSFEFRSYSSYNKPQYQFETAHSIHHYITQ